MCSCENIGRKFGTLKRRIHVPKHTSFSSFCIHSGSEMLQNTTKHHFVPKGGNWVCSCENVRRKFDTPKQCIRVTEHTSFSSLCMHSGSEILQNTIKHHFRSNGGYWVCSCENVRRKFGTPKQCIRVTKHTSFLSLCMHSGSEKLQRTAELHFGSNGGY